MTAGNLTVGNLTFGQVPYCQVASGHVGSVGFQLPRVQWAAVVFCSGRVGNFQSFIIMEFSCGKKINART